MANLKVLIILRYFFIVLSAAFAACTIAFAVKCEFCLSPRAEFHGQLNSPPVPRH
jgi:hypothetical protein